MSASLPACWLSLPSALLTLLSLRLEPGQCRPCCLFFSERCWSATINVHFLPHSSPMPSVRAAGRSPHGGKEGRRDFAADLARQEGGDGSSANRRCHREVWLPRKACMPEMRIRLSVHIWAEPAGWWKRRDGTLLHACCWDMLSIHSPRVRRVCHCTKLAGCSAVAQKRTIPDHARCESCACRMDGLAQ